MKLRFALLIVTIAFELAATSSARADPRLDFFLKKYDALNGRAPLLDHADSPFYPYHERLFEDGLDAAKLRALRSAQRKGDCIAAEELVVEGFLGLYPFLKPAFDEQDRYSVLWFMISKDGRPEIGRCRDNRKLRRLFANRHPDTISPVDFAEVNFSKRHEYTDPKKPSGVLHGFGQHAFCDDYPPSIADLRGIANRSGGIVLTEEEGLYLLERAHLHGLAKSEYEKTLAHFSKDIGLEVNVSRLTDASRRYKLADIPFAVQGYWQEACRFERRYRRKKQQRGESRRSPK